MPSRRPPLSPEATAVVRAISAARPSRRAVLGGASALGVGALLAACGSGSASSRLTAQTAPSPPRDRSDSERTVAWANWPLYIDKDSSGNSSPSLQAFTKRTGIRASYSEDVEDNESYYNRVHVQLSRGEDIGRDLVVLTDYMAARLLREGSVQKLDDAAIPNKKNLLPALRDVSFDPGREYTLTWQSGFAGIAYNKEKVSKPLHRVEDLWRRDLKGGVEVLTEWRDTLGLILRSQGVDISKPFPVTTFDRALEVLQSQLTDGQIRDVKGNSYKDDLVSGDAVAAMAWSGDIFQLNAEHGDKWKFVLPDSGGTLFSDNLMIPIGSPHKKNAETLIDYYYEPRVAAEVAAYVNYVCPVQGAQEEMRRIDSNLASSSSIFPSEEELKKVQVFAKLDPDLETICSEAFQKTLGA